MTKGRVGEDDNNSNRGWGVCVSLVLRKSQPAGKRSVDKCTLVIVRAFVCSCLFNFIGAY